MHTPPPSVQMVQLLAGFQVSQALYATAKLGIPDQLVNGPRSAEDLAVAVQADPTALARLLRTLTAFGVVTGADTGQFELTDLGRTLVSDAPGSMRDLALMWMETHYGPFGGLVDTVRTGKTAADAYYGMPFFDWLAGNPEQVARFSGAMANLTDGMKAGAIAEYGFGDARTFVDVGGSDGTLLAHVLTRLPDATGVVYDLPHVVSAVENVAKANDLADRLIGAGGDFFESVPSGGDTYLLSMILHDWDDVRTRTILSNIAQAAPSGAHVRAFELVMPTGDEPHMAKMIDLTMLGMLSGRERTEAQLTTLFDGSGLRLDGIAHTSTPISVIEATVI
jgi:hypothetical protein